MSRNEMNILLELDDSNELIFSILSNVELKTEIQINERKYHSVKPKPNAYSGEELSIKVFYTPDARTKVENRPHLEEVTVKTEVIEEMIVEELPQINEPEEDEYPFACDLCERRYKNKTSLVRHKRQLHAEDETKHDTELVSDIVKTEYKLPEPNTEVEPEEAPAKNKEKSQNVTESKEEEDNSYKINLQSRLDYLPKGLSLPNFKKLKRPIRMPFSQPDGSTIYIYQESRKAAIWISNFDLKPKICELCDTPIANMGAFLVHRARYHFFPTLSNTCVGCNKTFNSIDTKHRHTFFCLGQKDFKKNFCYSCTIQFDDFKSFKKHFFTKHKRRLEEYSTNMKKCSLCDKDIAAKNMHKHMKLHEDLKRFECAHCNETFKRKDFVWNHLTTKHFSHMAKIVCNECDPPKYFNKEPKYLLHCQTHKKAKIDPFTDDMVEKIKCPHCTRFITKMRFDRHILTCKRLREKFTGAKPTFTCDICGKLFLTQGLVRTHKKGHLPEAERPHKCRFCNKGFNCPLRMEEHVRDHTGEKPYICPHCPKTFAKKQTYKDHLRSHTGRGYNCNHCAKVYFDQSSYRKHLKKHEREMGVKLTYTMEERRWKNIGLLDQVKDML